MKFDAATITPGLANIGQNTVEPSAKSIQSVFFCGMAHSLCARAWPGRNQATVTAAETPRRTLLTLPYLVAEARAEGSPYVHHIRKEETQGRYAYSRMISLVADLS